jgi:hypothetical protein
VRENLNAVFRRLSLGVVGVLECVKKENIVLKIRLFDISVFP